MASSDKSSHNDLAQRALSAFAEEAVSHAVDKINECRLENASLQAARDLLLKVQVTMGSNVLWEGSLLNCQDDDDGECQNGEDDENEEAKGEEYIFLSVDGVDPIPLQEIKRLACISSGLDSLALAGPFLHNTILWGDKRFSRVKEDGTVELSLKMGETCFVVGSLENFAGTIQDMKEMIGANRLCRFMLDIGMVDFETGEPVRDFQEPAVENATFRVRKIKLVKTAFQTILDEEKIAVEKAANDESVQQLRNLSETLTADSKLRKVSEEQAALLKENILLKASRDVVRSVKVSFTGGVACGNLDEGRVVSAEQERLGPLWLVNIQEEAKISLLDICKMRISLSGFPFGVWDWVASSETQVAPDMSLVRVPCNDKVSAFFTLDETWHDIDLETVVDGHHFVAWLRVQVAGGSNERVHYSIPNYDGPELFLKLAYLTFPVSMVRRNLEALGIEDPDAPGADDGPGGDDEDVDGEE